MPTVGAVILAAGRSSRLGEPKQFLQWQGESLVRRLVRVASSGCNRVAVVVGGERARIEAELRETTAEMVPNSDWQRGLGTSIHAGVSHLLDQGNQPDAIMVLACDQPFVDEPLIAGLIAKWTSGGKPIVAAAYANTIGIPALFDRSCFEELLALPADSGAKALIQSRGRDLATVEFEAGAFDIDTPTDYERAKARLGR